MLHLHASLTTQRFTMDCHADFVAPKGFEAILHWIASLDGPKLEQSLYRFYCSRGLWGIFHHRLDEADVQSVKRMLDSDHIAVIAAIWMGGVLSRAHNEALNLGFTRDWAMIYLLDQENSSTVSYTNRWRLALCQYVLGAI